MSRSVKLGSAPETAGRKRLADWAAGDGNTLTYAAEFVGVAVPSMHGWRWRKYRPAEEYRAALCALVGGKPEDWDTPEELVERRERAKRMRQHRGAAA